MLKKNWKSILNSILLMFVIGFPKIPGSDIPFCVILFLIFWRDIYINLNDKAIKLSLMLILCYFIIGIIIWFGHEGSKIIDLKFLATMYIKSTITVIAAIIVFILIKERMTSLILWAFYQSIIIVISVINKDVFDFLALFSGDSGFDVYSELYGVRGMGFGIVHVYGSITFLLSYGFMITILDIEKSRRINGIILAPIFLVSRTALIVWCMLVLVKSPAKLILAIIIFFIASYILREYFENHNILYQLMEPGINYLTEGEFYTKSTNANLEMLKFPNDLIGWIVGYGKYFEHGLFYLDTDLGFSRITLFGGIIFLSLVLIANIYPVLSGVLATKNMTRHKRSQYRQFFSICLVSFLLVNCKGIIDIGIFAYLAMIIVRNKSIIVVK